MYVWSNPTPTPIDRIENPPKTKQNLVWHSTKANVINIHIMTQAVTHTHEPSPTYPTNTSKLLIDFQSILHTQIFDTWFITWPLSPPNFFLIGKILIDWLIQISMITFQLSIEWMLHLAHVYLENARIHLHLVYMIYEIIPRIGERN